MQKERCRVIAIVLLVGALWGCIGPCQYGSRSAHGECYQDPPSRTGCPYGPPFCSPQNEAGREK